MTTRLTDTDRDQILTMVRDGATRGDIAEQFGRSPSTITAVCRRAGVTFNRNATSTDTAVDPGRVDKPRGRESAVLRAEVVDLYRLGLTFEAIGKRLGFSRQRAHKLYWDAMHAVQMQAVDTHRAAMIDELAEAVRVAARILHTDHIAHSNGRVVYADDGSPVIDDGPKMDAARTIISAHARLAKLLGADAPVKSEVSAGVEINYTIRGVDTDKL